MGSKKKIKAIIESPYFQTLYVDTDTIFVDTVDELFHSLNILIFWQQSNMVDQ